jgi:hypothetical protein
VVSVKGNRYYWPRGPKIYYQIKSALWCFCLVRNHSKIDLLWNLKQTTTQRRSSHYLIPNIICQCLLIAVSISNVGNITHGSDIWHYHPLLFNSYPENQKTHGRERNEPKVCLGLNFRCSFVLYVFCSHKYQFNSTQCRSYFGRQLQTRDIWV